MRKKLNENKIYELINDYKTGTFTRKELSVIYEVSKSTVDRYLKWCHKPFMHDAMTQAISLDWLREKGHEISANHDVLPQWSGKQVQCPSCDEKLEAMGLLIHLIRQHHRFDLEYLLDEYI